MREASNGYEASNDVKAFYKNEVRAPSGASNASQVASTQQQNPTWQQNKNGIPPWHTESVGAEAVVPF